MKSSSSYTSEIDQLNLKIEILDQLAGNNRYDNDLTCNDNQFRIIWITEGECSVNRKTFVIDDKNCIVCLGKSNASQLTIMPGAKGFSISFSADFLKAGELELDIACQSKVLFLFSNLKEIVLDQETATDLKDVFSRIQKELDNLFPFRTEVLGRFLKIFLIYLSRYVEIEVQVVQHTRNMKLLQEFMGNVEQNYKAKRMVGDYADLLFVSPNYLNEVVKKMTGYPAGYHIRNRVVREAKRLAIATDNSMKEIAYLLGFEDTAHFSKFFKSTAGNNFSNFKKEKPVAVFK